MDEQDGFDRRLRDARQRGGLDRAAEPGGAKPPTALGIGFRVGVEVFAALAVGVALGLGLDYWLGTKPWLFIVFFLLGGAAGVLNVMRVFNPPRG